MPILTGDVVLLESQVMDDVPEGGGAATGNVIPDGAVNGIFPDISELDRAIGRVSLRKVFPAIRTNDRDTFFGAHVIVSDPPNDPNISVLLFNTEDYFDRRENAQNRIESYLARGPKWGGYLFDNHIAGQRAITLLQKTGTKIPNVGQTLILVAAEGDTGEYEQYVRITSVEATAQQFSRTVGGQVRYFERLVVLCEISDPLRYNFAGGPATETDDDAALGGIAIIRSAMVADAASYYGASQLALAAALGTATVKVSNVYAAIVPSAQTEVPVADATPAQSQQGVQPSNDGSTVTLSGITLSPSQAAYLAGSILPGSLSIAFGAITMTDAAGALSVGGTSVGTIDYVSGILKINSGGSTYSGGAATWRPAAQATTVTDSLAVPVLAENRSLSYVVTLSPIPARGSLTFAYMAGGRWYELKDQGGALKGADPSHGAGSINYTTGTASITLGALPDVGSKLLYSWGPPAVGTASGGPSLTRRLWFDVTLAKAVTPGSVTVSWSYGGTKTVTDDGAGNLTGDGQGKIDYSTGHIQISPNVLPPKNTAVSVAFTNTGASVSANVSVNEGSGGSRTIALSPNVKPRTFKATVTVEFPFPDFSFLLKTTSRSMVIFDDGTGGIIGINPRGSLTATMGTINYATGTITLNPSFSYLIPDYPDFGKKSLLGSGPTTSVSSFKLLSYGDQTVTATVKPVTGGVPVNYGTSAGAADAGAGVMGVARTNVIGEYMQPDARDSRVSGALRAKHGTKRYDTAGGNFESVVYRDVSPTTGVGTNVGTFSGSLGLFTLTEWTAGDSSTLTFEGLLQELGNGLTTDTIAFRTPIAPLRPGSFSITAERLNGPVVTATANLEGKIDTADIVGTVDYETGIAEVRFRQTSGDGATGSPSWKINVQSLGIPGLTDIYATHVKANSIRFNCVGYSYIPLDADVIGLDPVRLPSDGRVPIFRKGDTAVAINSKRTAPAPVSNGQTIDVARDRLSRVRVIGSNGLAINTGWTANLDTGRVTFSNVAGYAQPVEIEHSVEDVALVTEVQIDGTVSLARALTHDYPLGSYLASALILADRRARVSTLFDQQTWSGVWSDDPIGSAATGTYNDVTYPVGVTNRGAITERWAIRFTNTTNFEVIGEHVGVVALGSTAVACEPPNPAAGVPYFSINPLGWGAGWAAGNVLRFNSVGAIAPVWIARTVQQGPATEENDSFTMLIRGDVDRP